jgi:hypothetical protein
MGGMPEGAGPRGSNFRVDQGRPGLTGRIGHGRECPPNWWLHRFMEFFAIFRVIEAPKDNERRLGAGRSKSTAVFLGPVSARKRRGASLPAAVHDAPRHSDAPGKSVRVLDCAGKAPAATALSRARADRKHLRPIARAKATCEECFMEVSRFLRVLRKRFGSASEPPALARRSNNGPASCRIHAQFSN